MTLRFLLACAVLVSCAPPAAPDDGATAALRAKLKAIPMSDKVQLSEEEWKKLLTPEQYRVMRESGTERACSGAYWNNHEEGAYHCAACGNELFSSKTKFESGTGWPSFFEPIAKDKVEDHEDRSHGMVRDEVRCARCGSHLGHVFKDGPPPSGLRYCINSVAMKFEKEK